MNEPTPDVLMLDEEPGFIDGRPVVSYWQLLQRFGEAGVRAMLAENKLRLVVNYNAAELILPYEVRGKAGEGNRGLTTPPEKPAPP